MENRNTLKQIITRVKQDDSVDILEMKDGDIAEIVSAMGNSHNPFVGKIVIRNKYDLIYLGHDSKSNCSGFFFRKENIGDDIDLEYRRVVILKSGDTITIK